MTTDHDPAPDFDVAALFDRLPIPLYATARDGRVLAANRAFWDIWEQPIETQTGIRTKEFYADPAERDRVITELDKSDLEIIDWEQVIDTPKGVRWIKPLSRVVRDAEGKLERYEGGFLTVNPLPDAGSIEQQQRILLERTADPVVILDPDGQVLWANASARRLLEITEASVQARPSLADLADVAVPMATALADAPFQGERTFTIRGRRHRYWVSLEAHLGSDGNPAFYSYIGRDLSALDRTSSLLAESILVRDRVISTVAHEMRTPLTSVLGLSEQLAETLAATGKAEDAELAALIAEEAADLAKIVDDLVVSSANGRSRADIKPLDLRHEASAAIQTSGFAVGDIEINGEATALGDASWVRRIARNLLTNARRYGKPPISVELAVGSDGAHLLVRDHGPGPNSELVRTIFEPYVSQGGAPGDTALGLGLTVSRALAMDMGGSLEYRRTATATDFDLRLPISPE